MAVAFAPSGKTLAVGCDDGTARLWDLQTRQWTGGTLDHLSTVKELAFRPDGLALLTASTDGFVRLWDLTGLASSPEPLYRGVEPARLALDPSGRSLLVNEAQGVGAALWDFDAGPGPPASARTRRRQSLQSRPSDPTAASGLYDAAFRPDGRVFATAGTSPPHRCALRGDTGSVVRLWESGTGRSLGSPVRFKGRVRGLAFLTGNTLFVADGGSAVRAWDLTTG